MKQLPLEKRLKSKIDLITNNHLFPYTPSIDPEYL